MAGRRVDRLITHIRKITDNQLENASTEGISDNEIIEYVNEAQHRLQARIVEKHPRLFEEQTTIDLVSGTEEYSLPDNCFLASKVVSVELSTDGGSTYYFLKQGRLHDRYTNTTGVPCKWIRRDKLTDDSGSLLLSPVPGGSNYKLRVTYIRRIDELDKRRGIVSAVTLDSGTSTITTLTLDTSGNPPIDSDDLGEHDFICVVDSLGAMKMRNIRFDSVSTSTGAVTVNSSFTYDSGETIAVGDYIVGGKDTTTHSSLSRNLERYLIQYVKWQLFAQDSNSDADVAAVKLQQMEQDILLSYSEMTEGPIELPVYEYWD